MARTLLYSNQTASSLEIKSNGSSTANNIFVDFLVSNMFVLIVIAAMADMVNGAILCPNVDRVGKVDCTGQNLTTIPEIPRGELEV